MSLRFLLRRGVHRALSWGDELSTPHTLAVTIPETLGEGLGSGDRRLHLGRGRTALLCPDSPLRRHSWRSSESKARTHRCLRGASPERRCDAPQAQSHTAAAA